LPKLLIPDLIRNPNLL